jgi:ribosomal protein S18 acetylase RimI-like enzyme
MIKIEVPPLDMELVAAMGRLIPQLTSSPPPNWQQVANILFSRDSTLLVARDEETDKIVGTAMLHLFRKPTGLVGLIEDVVVDEEARGQGIAKALVTSLLETANLAGARQVDLTSNSSRVEANGLYKRLGFEQYDTNHYRYALPG